MAKFPVLKGVLGLVVIAIAVELVAHLLAEVWWYQELGYLGVFLGRLAWQLVLGLGVVGLSASFGYHHLRQAQKFCWPAPCPSNTQLPSSRYLPEPPPAIAFNYTPPLSLLPLLGVIVGLGGLLTGLLIYTVYLALAAWTPRFTLPNLEHLTATTGSAVSSVAPVTLGLWGFWGTVGLTLLVIWQPRRSLMGILILLSGLWGAFLTGHWAEVAKSFNPIPFPQVDPQFHLNIGFYIFQFPLWQRLAQWLIGLWGASFISVALRYLTSGQSLSEGKFPGFSREQLAHLCRLGGGLMLLLSWGHSLMRFQRLYQQNEVVYGVNYTDVHWRLPLDLLLILVAAAIALGCAYYGWQPNKLKKQTARPTFPRFSWVLGAYGALMVLQILGGITMELAIVQPNQLTREKPYLARNIQATRSAFRLSEIQSLTLSGSGELTTASLRKNLATLNNIRLWDPQPLLATNRQLQQIRLYYRFFDADLDRYTITEHNLKDPNSKAKKSLTTSNYSALNQVLISPRELDYQAVPPQAQTWVNQHLVYTHGYGFTLSPVNLVDRGGLPFYFVKDIGTDTQADALRTSSEVIRENIPIGKPRIYFGELTDTYIMTQTKLKEFDFPRGQENAYNVYDGTGGIRMGSWARRLLFAVYLRDWQMLFTRNFTADTQILFRRNINQRIREIAPFLAFDRNPYLVTAKTDPQQPNNTLFWIIDAYTTSQHYPYSEPIAASSPWDQSLNYIRNSVKITVDAYNGKVNFYVMDQQDPLIQSWQRIFPTLFQPLSAMPPSLKRHIRYPVDLLSTQSEQLLTYHMTDLDVFYNREDQWQIPREIYGNQQLAIAPYYLIMKLAGLKGNQEEFVLSHVYTPISRNNLIALLFARSDGENYGKLVLYTLPKERLVYGPEQVEALINQDPVISERISLWNREGSKAIQGNLLVIPIEQSLLYVEPLYLEAEKSGLPTLARVVVVYGNQIAMAETLQGALDAIFAPKGSNSAILRQISDNNSVQSIPLN